MKPLLIALFCAVAAPVFGESTFAVEDFSDAYYAKVTLADPSEVFSPGSISIYEKTTNRLLIRVDSEELAVTLDEGKAKANVKELPYGEQSVVMYDDFNFDGRKDFAIEDGQNSCYHGPSYRIYLAGNDGFTYNEDFTRLAQDYCGMFEVKVQEKRLATMSKDGCCLHEYSEFVVENNKPKAVTTVDEDATDFPYVIDSKQDWDGSKMVESTTRTVDTSQEGVRVLFSFALKSNGKKVLVFSVDDSSLAYVLLQKSGAIEFGYPLDAASDDPMFTYKVEKDRSVLDFSNKEASYRIYQDRNASGSAGVLVTVGSVLTDLPADPGSVKGVLSSLAGESLENLVSIH